MLILAPPMTVSQVSLLIKQHIEKEFSSVYLQGEISGCKYHSSGHIYFSIKDDTSVIDAICWKFTRLSITLQDGMMVICRGKITTYGGRSKYQLIVETLEHAGQGALLLLLEKLKEKLAKEGLFSVERKKLIPPFPSRIGLITSPTGAVIQDMISRFQERLPCELVLYPVTVQGPSTVGDVIKALEYFHHCLPRPDVIIIARGGGSIEDLWAFNDEQIVRAVAASQIPIISAIGHETDTTLTDYAADVRAPTPTAAAEIALPSCEDLEARLKANVQRMAMVFSHSYTLKQTCLNSMRLPTGGTFLAPLEQRLDYAYEALSNGCIRYMTKWSNTLQQISGRLGRGPIFELTLYEQKINSLMQNFTQFLLIMLAQKEAFLATCERFIITLSYRKTLERGFAIVLTPDQHIITSAIQAQNIKKIRLLFHDGQIEAKPL